MATLSVVLSRTALSLTPLDVSAGLYRIVEDGISDPDIGWRRTYAADSPYTHGSELVAAVKEQTSIPLEVLILASSALELSNACNALYAALDQFSYTCTVTVDGIARVWSCDPAAYNPGPIKSDEQAGFLRHIRITIPVYPIPGA